MKFIACPNCDQLFVKTVDKKSNITCCDQPLEDININRPLKEADEHYPIIRKIGNFVTITFSHHPMVKTHHISSVYLETNQGFQYKHLPLNSVPKVEFILTHEEEIVNVYVYCNIHLISSLY